MIKKFGIAGLATVLALSTAGCGTPQGQNAGTGALLGAGTGALIGGLATGRPGGALLGAGLGAATGAAVGAAATPPGPRYYPAPPVGYPPPPPPRCYRRGYDAYGNPVCLQYYGY